MRKYFCDRCKVEVVGLSALYIFEVTIRKDGAVISENKKEMCPNCSIDFESELKAL